MSLRGFLADMQRKNQLVQVNDEVSPRFEVSAFMKEFDNGPVLYFDSVKGSRSKIVAGACGTRQRLCWALGTNQETLYQKITEAWREPAQPKIARGGPVNEVVEKAFHSLMPPEQYHHVIEDHYELPMK
jgi:UbiD family decarboxylase